MTTSEEKKGFLGDTRNAALVAIVSAILGSTGAPFILVKFGINPYRPNAYTADMAKARQSIVDLRLDSLEAHHDEWDAAILALQREASAAAKEREQLLRNQERILDRLEK